MEKKRLFRILSGAERSDVIAIDVYKRQKLNRFLLRFF